MQRRKQALINAGSFQHGLRPFALRNIEEKSTGCFGDIYRTSARKPEPEIILRQQNRASARPDFGLVLLYPPYFRQRKIGQRRIRGQFDQALGADALSDLLALLAGALVAPDDRRAQNLTRRVEQHQTMHLPGETDRSDLARRCPVFFKARSDSKAAGLPPIVRILF